MAIVTVKNKYQIGIPQGVREKLGINPGDLLEAKVERGKLTYTRKSIVDSDRIIPADRAARARFFKQLQADAPEWLTKIQRASKAKGTDKLTMREINAEIAAARRERAKPKRSA